MIQIRQETTAAPINRILNDPEVRPWIADAAEGVIDISDKLENPHVYFLMGEHGGVMLNRIMTGVFEVHTFVAPAGRGVWALEMIRAAQHWLFTKTECYEVLTRIPQTHVAAKGLAIKAGMKLEFTRPDGVVINGEMLSVDVYSLTLTDWVHKAPGLEERGARFHEWLNAEAAKAGFNKPHENDPNHNRYVGAALSIILGGQYMKGVVFYNRWAVLARHAVISLLSVDPPTVQFDVGLLKLADGNLEFVPWKPVMN